MHCLWLSMAVVWGMAVLLYCFWNNFKWISIINGYSNGINRRKNLKCCEFFSEDIVSCMSWNSYKSMTLVKCYLPIVWNKYLLTKNLHLDNSYAFPKAVLHECQRSCKFADLYSSFVFSMSDNSVYCIWLFDILSAGKNILWFFC